MEAREIPKRRHMDGAGPTWMGGVRSSSPMPALFLFNSKTDSDPELGIQVLGQATQSGTN